MIKKWFKIVDRELNKVITEVAPFRYGNVIGAFIQATGLLFILSGIYYFYSEERVTYFARFGSIFVGILMSIIGKVLIAIMYEDSKGRSIFFKVLISLLDGLLWASVISAVGYEVLLKVFKFELESLLLSEIFIFLCVLIVSIVSSFILHKNNLANKVLVYYICLVMIPFRIIFIFVKKEYRLFVTVVTVASILLLTMILLSFQVGGFLEVINPFKSINVYYPTMVLFMVLSDKLVTYVVPKTSFSKYFGHKDDLAKIFLTWGMIVAKAALYMFDWKLLMQGTLGWNDSDKNIVLWAFTTYRLLATMLDDKFNLLKKGE